MKKILLLIILSSFLTLSSHALFKKKIKALIILSSYNPNISKQYDTKLLNQEVFRKNSKIYFQIFNPEGFKSDYIKYQIIKQNDKAHTGGYNRIRNVTVRIKNKNYYTDYFTLSETGKYYIQIFDIENLQQWVSFAHFTVIDD